MQQQSLPKYEHTDEDFPQERAASTADPADVEAFNAEPDTEQLAADALDPLLRIDMQLQAEQQTLAAAEEKAAALRHELEEAEAALAVAQTASDELRLQQAEAIEHCAALQENELELHHQLQRELQEKVDEATSQQQALHEQVKEAKLHLEACYSAREKAIANAEERFAVFSEKRSLSSTLLAEKETSELETSKNHADTANRLMEELQQCTADSTAAAVARDAAKKTADLAELAYHDLKQELEAIQTEQENKKELLTLQQTTRREELEAIKAAATKIIAEAQAKEEAAKAVVSEKLTTLHSAENFSRLAQNSYLNAEDRLTSLVAKLKKVNRESETFSQEIAERMEQILANINEKSAICLELNEHHQVNVRALQEKEDLAAESLQKLNQLKLEKQDLQSALYVAEDLVAGATTAKQKASAEMLPTLTAMEQALISSAREARNQLAEKEQACIQAEEEYISASALREGKQQAFHESKQRLDQAEQECQRAKQRLLELKEHIDQNDTKRYQYKNALQMLRTVYEQTLTESSILKEAVDTAEKSLHEAKVAAEQAERDYYSASNKTKAALRQYDDELAALGKKWNQIISETNYSIFLLKDKQQALQDGMLQKESLYLNCNQEYLQNAERAVELAAKQSQLETEVNETLLLQKEQLEQAVAAQEQSYQAALQEEEQASIAYNDALLDSIQASDQVSAAQTKLTILEAEERAFLDQVIKARARDEQEAEQKRNKLAKKHALLNNKIEDIREKITAYSAELDQAKSIPMQLTEALHALSGTIAGCKKNIELLIEEKAELQEKQQRYLQQEEENRLLEQQKREEEQRQAEEEEARQQQLAAERAEQERQQAEIAAEKQAALLAAGKILSKEDNLALLKSGEIEERLQRAKELIQAEAWAAPAKKHSEAELNQLAQEAEELQQQAAEKKSLFTASQSTLNAISSRREQIHQEHEALAEKQSDLISYCQKLEENAATLNTVTTSLEEVLATEQISWDQQFQQSTSPIAAALQLNQAQLQASQAELEQTKLELAALEEVFHNVEKEYDDALDILNDITVNWIYSETNAMKAQAKLETPPQNAAAADTVQPQTPDSSKRIGSVAKNLPKRYKKK